MLIDNESVDKSISCSKTLVGLNVKIQYTAISRAWSAQWLERDKNGIFNFFK